jgi:hypothetical protein
MLSFVGCKQVKIKDGHVPKEYLSEAKKVEGTYSGRFDGKRATIQIYLDGDQPRLKYVDQLGEDMLDVRCGSKIGLLKLVELSKKNGTYVLDRAVFEFHPGVCRRVLGRELELDFSGSNKFLAGIYDYSDYRQRCDPSMPPVNGGGSCRMEEIPHYITGNFVRQK